MIARIATLIFALAAYPAAGAPVLEQPIDCTLGETCYIQNYVDADPTPSWSDFACGGLSYDGHKGTDFALPTVHDMTIGVRVLAAADGLIAGTRDGMDDVAKTSDTLASVKGRECGNGVAIDHGDGWITQYCHMKKGSISVQKGERITAGAVLGQVGLSGKTEFPHLHISVRQDGNVVDPFAPSGPSVTCKTDHPDSLWSDGIPYVAGGIVRLGFDTKVPSYADVKSGAAGAVAFPANTAALVLFVQGFGSRANDQIKFSITGPDGFSFSHSETVAKPKALYMQAAGKKRAGNTWARGKYEGTVTLIRDGQIYDQSQHSVTLN